LVLHYTQKKKKYVEVLLSKIN